MWMYVDNTPSGIQAAIQPLLPESFKNKTELLFRISALINSEFIKLLPETLAENPDLNPVRFPGGGASARMTDQGGATTPTSIHFDIVANNDDSITLHIDALQKKPEALVETTNNSQMDQRMMFLDPSRSYQRYAFSVLIKPDLHLSLTGTILHGFDYLVTDELLIHAD